MTWDDDWTVLPPAVGEDVYRMIPVIPMVAVRECVTCGGDTEWLQVVNGYVVGRCHGCAVTWVEDRWEQEESPLAGRAEHLLKQYREVLE